MSDALIMRRGGSGGGEVKFIFASQCPTSAEENSVFIQTATEPASWIFSVDKPSSPTEGLMWFQVSGVSSAPFNIFEDNSLMVYPVSCRLYTGGAWKTLNAATYRGGKWNQWAVYLMQKGVATDLGTGLTTGVAPWMPSTTFYNSGTVSSGTNCFIMSATVGCGALGILVSTKNKIDLTPYSRIEIKIKSVSSSGQSPRGQFDLMASTVYSGTNHYTTCAAIKSSNLENINAANPYYMDISSLSGSYYVSMGISHWGNTIARGGEITIEDVYLY